MKDRSRIDAEIDRVFRARWRSEEDRAKLHQKLKSRWYKVTVRDVKVGDWMYEDENTAFGIMLGLWQPAIAEVQTPTGKVRVSADQPVMLWDRQQEGPGCDCENCTRVAERAEFMAAIDESPVLSEDRRHGKENRHIDARQDT